MKHTAALVLGFILIMQGALGTGFTTTNRPPVVEISQEEYDVVFSQIQANDPPELNLPDGYYDKATPSQRILSTGAILELCNDMPYQENKTDCSVRGAFLEYALKKNGIYTRICTAHLSFNDDDVYHMYLKIYEPTEYTDYYYVNPSKGFPDNVISPDNTLWEEYDHPMYTDGDLMNMYDMDRIRGFTQDPKEYAWWDYPEMQRANDTLNKLMRA